MDTQKLPIALGFDELQQYLEPLIRRIIREELSRVVEQQAPKIFFLHPDTPLYEDMEEIAHRHTSREIELLSHDEVWS